MLSTARKAPSNAPPTAIQVRSGTAASAGGSLILSMADLTLGSTALSLAARESHGRRVAALFGIDRRFDRHPGTQAAGQGVTVIEDDFDRDALDDLREIAGGIVRWQQRELLPAGGRDAVDMSMDHGARKGVYRDRGRLPWLNMCELG